MQSETQFAKLQIKQLPKCKVKHNYELRCETWFAKCKVKHYLQSAKWNIIYKVQS